MPRPCAGGGPWGFSGRALRQRRRGTGSWCCSIVVVFPTFSASRGVSAPHSYLIEVLSAVGKSLGTGMVTEPVAAHSVPR